MLTLALNNTARIYIWNQTVYLYLTKINININLQYSKFDDA